MPVKLLPPVTYSGGMYAAGDQPLAEAPRYLRGKGHGRWHRPRTGTVRADRWTSVMFWCGQSAALDRLIGRDDAPADELVCGTCEGRALGAGQDTTPDGMPSLIHAPRTLHPPRVCPGSRDRDLVIPLNDRYTVGRCRACGDVDSCRAMGRGYNAWGFGLVNHPPGAGLVAPCPWHAWRRMRPDGETSAACACGYQPEVTG